MVDSFSPPWVIGGFPPGAHIASYRLAELIGRGGMAVVFRAHDERLNRQVALKILAPALAADDAFRQRFVRESRAAAAVDDPNIIPVFEAGESDGVLFIAMRLVRGGNLRSLVAQQGPLPPARAEWIVSAVASALDAAHAAGLVHRDVKPANILLEARRGRPDHVYLSDFGLSKAALGSSGLTGSGQFLGTVDYAAPEQIQGLAVDGRTDQYALGCTAFELLCGQPPFLRDQGLAAVYAHLSEPPPHATSMQPGLPAEVDPVFARVLAKSAANRYDTCQSFAEALQTALGVVPYPADAAEAAPRRRPTDVVRPAPEAGQPVIGPPDTGVQATGTERPTRRRRAARDGRSRAAPAPAQAAPAPERIVPDPVAADGLVSDAAVKDVTGTDPPGPSSTIAAESPQPARQVAETVSPADLGPPGGVGSLPDESAKPGRRRSRTLIWGSLAVLAAAAAAAALVPLLGRPAAAAPGPISHSFAPRRYGGVVIVRLWKLSGQHRSVLTVRITAHNSTGREVAIKFNEPVPAQIAPILQKLIYRPRPSDISTAERIVEWNLAIPANGDAVVSYRTRIAAKPATQAMLNNLVAEFIAMESRESVTLIPAQLTSLRITPARIRLTVGQTYSLTLDGLMSDGTSAPASTVSKALWSTANPSVATIKSGKVTASGPGTTRITADIGTVRVSVLVTVTAAAAPNPGTTYYQPSTTSPRTPKPHSTPTPTL